MEFAINKFVNNQASVASFIKGFSLVEAMIAIFIITVGIIAVLQMFPLSIEQQKMGEWVTVAAELAQGKIEEKMSESYDDISTGLTTEDYGAIPGFGVYKRVTYATCVNPGFQDVSCSYNLSGDPEPIKKIEATVYWKSALGSTEKNLKIITLVVKK